MSSQMHFRASLGQPLEVELLDEHPELAIRRGEFWPRRLMHTKAAPRLIIRASGPQVLASADEDLTDGL
jgi:hypothetical protein